MAMRVDKSRKERFALQIDNFRRIPLHPQRNSLFADKHNLPAVDSEGFGIDRLSPSHGEDTAIVIDRIRRLSMGER